MISKLCFTALVLAGLSLPSHAAEAKAPAAKPKAPEIEWTPIPTPGEKITPPKTATERVVALPEAARVAPPEPARAPEVQTDNPSREHVLTTQDKLSFAVEQDPSPGKPIAIVVSADGQVDVPISRCCEQTITVRAAGKTIGQLENELQTLLAQEYYHNPKIQLRLVAGTARSGEVWVNGPVKQNQIRLRADRPTTVWEAIQLAQPNEFANLSKVRVQRLNPATRKLETLTVDVEAVNKGNVDKDMTLQDGDRIYIREKWLNL